MLRFFFIFTFLSVYAFAQVSGDQLDFQKAVSTVGDSAKISELDKFIAEHPNSSMLPNAYAVKFQVHVNTKNDSAAFRSIHIYLSLIDRAQLVPSLNAVAYEFAQRKYYVDSAMAFIDSAIALYDREEPVLYNTKALVLLRQKKYDEAELMQKKAISLLPENSVMDQRYVSFFIQMGFIHVESGHPLEGMKNIILGNLVVPKQAIPLVKIDSILVARNISAVRVTVVRDSLYRSAVGEYLRLSSDSIIAKSAIAVGLSRNNVLPDLALSFVGESYVAAQGRTIEERSGAAAAVGLTYYHLHRYADAERYLSEAAAYASPAETELFLSLGDVKEHLGKKSDAFRAYLTGAMNTRTTAIYQKLIELKNELFPTGNLDSMIVAHQAEVLQFSPEQFIRPARTLKKNESDRVVLAELFTGSECKPCQAADIAFDYLIERYRTSSLAILEYHLHIPLPDPMVNDDAERRAEYYGVHSTPTAIFNGTSIITSGGNRMMAKNKFYLYADIIEREGRDPVPVMLSASVELENGVVSVRGSATVPSKSRNLRVKIMLAEEEVLYQGANGVEHHKFVVRKTITPEAGLVVPQSGKLTINQKVSINAIQASLQNYYTKTNAHYTTLGSPLRENLSMLDPQRLALVIIVQNEETKKVLQSLTEKVHIKGKKK
ncbi:MAG: hypothetical protein WCX28_03835 [Bacteriovoracaceae bacterium]|nr:hypothetical protein [Bacteroidota bacterium]